MARLILSNILATTALLFRVCQEARKEYDRKDTSRYKALLPVDFSQFP